MTNETGLGQVVGLDPGQISHGLLISFFLFIPRAFHARSDLCLSQPVIVLFVALVWKSSCSNTRGTPEILLSEDG